MSIPRSGNYYENMTACLYFLQGNCRRGNRCRFVHAVPNSSFKEESSRNNKCNDFIDHVNFNNKYKRKNNIFYINRSYKRRNEYSRNEKQYQTNHNRRNQRFTSKRRHQSEISEPGLTNRFHQYKNERVPPEYRRQKDPREDMDKYDSNTLKLRVKFKVEGSELQSTNHAVDLDTNKRNLTSVGSVKEDMKEWELGSQWPFTCYSPFQSIYNFPGFLDLSAEELRYEAYKAGENNTFDSYLNSLNIKFQNVNCLRNQLKNPSVESISFIEEFCTRQGVITNSEINDISKSNWSSDVDMLVDE